MKEDIVIEDVQCWMDGGTVTLTIKMNSTYSYEVEFVQKVSFINRIPLPGSFLLNKEEIEIRSKLEKDIISEIKIAKFGTKIIGSEKELLKKIITEAIEFIESEDYIIIAKKVGRIK